MAETATRCLSASPGNNLPGRGASLTIAPSAMATSATERIRSQLGISTKSPVTQNGSFEFDRVIKSGYLQKRTQKTKAWKPVFLVLRPNALFMYKSDKESKLRHKIELSELSAVTLLKDPKQKRQNLLGLFSQARNYHFEAQSQRDAEEWVDLIRKDARIEEEEEEMFLTSPIVRRQSFAPTTVLEGGRDGAKETPVLERERFMTSSPEPMERPTSNAMSSIGGRRPSHHDYSGVSGNEMASDLDASDVEPRGHGTSMDVPSTSTSANQTDIHLRDRPALGGRSGSHMSNLNIENDPDRVVWHGWMWFLKSKRGMKQWKNCWAVLRPRNLILYKDESEYTASFILPLSTVVNVVDIDPISRTKTHCMQVITDEKGYRFCAHDEEGLVRCLGAFKSLLSKRKELEARAVTSSNVASR
ncbi:PH domain-containing protein [Xylariomycetidae sp. FL0641]|nr:PH domain-containing protein [Xylariomycetidae sp. FL0641]